MKNFKKYEEVLDYFYDIAKKCPQELERIVVDASNEFENKYRDMLTEELDILACDMKDIEQRVEDMKAVLKSRINRAKQWYDKTFGGDAE